MEPVSMLILGGAASGMVGGVASLLARRPTEASVLVDPGTIQAASQAITTVANEAGQAATRVEGATSSTIGKTVVAALGIGAAVATTIIALKALSARRAREDLAYARKQWVKDIHYHIGILTKEDLQGLSEWECFYYLVQYHPPLYEGWTHERVAQTLASGNHVIFEEQTGWNLRKDMETRRIQLDLIEPDLQGAALEFAKMMRKRFDFGGSFTKTKMISEINKAAATFEERFRFKFKELAVKAVEQDSKLDSIVKPWNITFAPPEPITPPEPESSEVSGFGLGGLLGRWFAV